MLGHGKLQMRYIVESRAKNDLKLVEQRGFELMAIASWHPFKTRRRVAELAQETI